QVLKFPTSTFDHCEETKPLPVPEGPRSTPTDEPEPGPTIARSRTPYDTADTLGAPMVRQVPVVAVHFRTLPTAFAQRPDPKTAPFGDIDQLTPIRVIDLLTFSALMR